MGGFTTVRDLLRRAVADSPSVTKTIAEGRRAALKGESTNSLFGGAARWVANKVKGKDKVDDWLYERLHRPLKNLDEKGGKLLADKLHAPKLFHQVDVLPTSSKIEGNRALIEHGTHSATAPIGKASKVITPIAASLYVADKLNKDTSDKMTEAQPPSEDKNQLLKEASAGLRRAYRRKEAEKLAFSLVEKGKIKPFESFEQFQDKVAEIESKDLAVVKEALAMDAQLADFGKVAEDQRPSGGAVGTDAATSNFFHTLADS